MIAAATTGPPSPPALVPANPTAIKLAANWTPNEIGTKSQSLARLIRPRTLKRYSPQSMTFPLVTQQAETGVKRQSRSLVAQQLVDRGLRPGSRIDPLDDDGAIK